MTEHHAGPRTGPGVTHGQRHARPAVRRKSAYPYALYLPAAVVYTVIFLVPTAMAFYFALTRW
ncbi:hypothetical protein, partial [Streptosporangium fragile]|uniref:hypothetical protein n=1 Tax=Streptosporangium fragile TaxID=46186 RepID=UPI0031F12317